MAETRPSGTPIAPDAEALIAYEVAEIGIRGRLHLLPRWAERAGWLPVPAPSASVALMVFAEPGLLSIRNWEPDGPRIAARYRELSQLGEDADLDALQSIHDRYGKLPIPKDRRPYLGDSALQHLGLPTSRGVKSNVYVMVSTGRIDILSPAYRNTKNIEGHPVLDDLP